MLNFETWFYVFKIFQHHAVDGSSGSHTAYGWNYWPHELERSSAGYVGLVNLGATCYMASCVQQLFMIPKARAALLQVEASDKMKFHLILKELQKMFTYLQVCSFHFDFVSFCCSYFVHLWIMLCFDLLVSCFFKSKTVAIGYTIPSHCLHFTSRFCFLPLFCH